MTSGNCVACVAGSSLPWTGVGDLAVADTIWSGTTLSLWGSSGAGGWEIEYISNVAIRLLCLVSSGGCVAAFGRVGPTTTGDKFMIEWGRKFGVSTRVGRGGSDLLR